MLKKLLTFSGIALFSSAFSQKTHTVARGDNPYNIARQYGMSAADFERLNPQVKNGKLSIGDVVKVSGKKDAVQKKAPTAATKGAYTGKTGKIILQPKQTIYGITRQYHISESELRRLNPNLGENTKIGDAVALPMENITKYGSSEKGTLPAATQLPVAQDVSAAGFYTVQPQDNYYRIGKKFNVSQKEIYALNPGLEATGLQPGARIRVVGTASTAVPSPAIFDRQPAAAVESPAEDYVTYTVQSGDTVFGITNKYGVSLDDLLVLNPQLLSGLKQGMVLKIKKIDATYAKKNSDALSVVFMLPFGFDNGDSRYRTMAADFLAGARLAIERNAGHGQKLDIKVVDAGSEASFKNSLSQINQDNTDLIVGPFFKSNVVEVLKYVSAKKIPVIAPFANAPELFDYSNLILVQPQAETFAARIAKEVSTVYADQKIYILADEDASEADIVKNDLQRVLKNPSITVVHSAAEIVADKNMMTGQTAPVIAILAAQDNDLGSSFSGRIVQLASETPGIHAFSTNYQPSFDKNTDALGKAGLVYLADRKINPDGEFEKEVLADYKKKYCKTPSKYAVIGFDVANDALTRENKRGEILRQMDKSQTQLATKFEYSRAKPGGAFINTGYRVVRLAP